MQAMPKFGSLPFTINESGEASRFAGINALILLQTMHSAGNKDPRFFVASQIEKRNWAIKNPAKNPVELLFYKRSDDNGIVLPYPEKQLFHVLNGSNIQGVPELINPPSVALEQIAKAYEFEGDDRAIEKMILSKCVQKAYASKEMHLLCENMAKCFLNVETGANFKNELSAEVLESISQYIERNPTAPYEAAKQITKDMAQALEPVKTYIVQANVNRRNREQPMYRNLALEERVEEMFKNCEAVIAVPYEERGEAKKLGAVWSSTRNIWFIPQGQSVSDFKKWKPSNWSLSIEAAKTEIISSFKDAMAQCGVDNKIDIQDDGEWHYVTALTKKSAEKNKSGSYIFSMTGSRKGGPLGTIINRDNGVHFTWTYKGPLMTSEQLAHVQAEARQQQEKVTQKRLENMESAARHAKEIYEMGQPVINFPYCKKKGMVIQEFRQISGAELKKFPEFHSESGSSIIRSSEDYLLIPMYNISGELRAVQAINHDGSVKSFMRGGQKSGTYYLIGADSFSDLVKKEVPYVSYVEGIATGDAFWQITKEPVLVCFDAGNLENMVKETEKSLSDRTVRVIATDNDQFFVEKALGALSEKLGVVANPTQGEPITVYAGADTVRTIQMGDVVPSDEWIKTAKGSYKCKVKKDDQNVTTGISFDIVAGKAEPLHLEFGNRGLNAGKVSVEYLKKAEKQVVLALPEFEDLGKRPTDWNDLLKQEGLQVAIAQTKNIAGLDAPKLEKQLEQELGRQREFLKTFKVRAVGIGR